MSKRISRAAMLEALNLPAKLPADYHALHEHVVIYSYPPGYTWRKLVEPDATVDVRKSAGSSKHRIYIQCSKCSKFVPFGRYNQHYGTGTCK